MTLSDTLGLACRKSSDKRIRGGTTQYSLYSCDATYFKNSCLVQIFSIRDSFDVRDASGQTAFQLQGALVSMREVSCWSCHCAWIGASLCSSRRPSA